MNIRKILFKEISLGLNGKLMVMAVSGVVGVSDALAYYARLGEIMGLPIFMTIVFSFMTFHVYKEKNKAKERKEGEGG